MEERKSSRSKCRIGVHTETGRVQWSVGNEGKWPGRLKKLALIPIVLLPLIVVLVFLTRKAHAAQDLSYRILDNFEILEDEDRREILRDVRTAFITHNQSEDCLESPRAGRYTRDLHSKSIAPKSRNDQSALHHIVQIKEHLGYRFPERWFDRRIQLNGVQFTEVAHLTVFGGYASTAEAYFARPLSLGELKSRNAEDCPVITPAMLETGINYTGDFSSGNVLDSFWRRKLNRQEVRRLQAQIMKKYMNSNVSPCTDFYTYACGNWKTFFTIPADHVNYDTFEMLRESLDVQLRDLLTTPIEEPVVNYSSIRHYNFKIKYPNETMTFGDEPTKHFQDAATKAKLLYISCMNEDILMQRGAAPLKHLLGQLGGWPVLDAGWYKRDFDLVWLLAQLKLINNDVLISEWIGPDIKDSDKYAIQIDQTTLGLPSKEYFTDPVNWRYIEAYREFIMTTMLLMGARVAQAHQAANEIIEFETGLAIIMHAPSERRNVSAIYIRTTIGALASYLPHFDWLKYFTLVLNRKMSVHDNVVCYCPQYLNKLVTLLSTTRKDIIANYILWRFVRHRTNNLDSNFIHAKQKFYQVLFGRLKSPPRWQFCVNQVNANMGMAVGNLFVKRYFDERSKNDTLDMTMQLQNSFENLLSNNEWIDHDTKAYAKMKIRRMNLKIGYPDFILEKQKLNSQYMDVQIHPHYFFENILSLLRHSAKQEQDRFGTMVDKETWATAPAVVNAYYSRNKNQIMFPAGILQPPFYHRFFPKALNFGGIGVVIGHEITHGFDDKGRLFDYNGNLEKWWHQSSIDKFRLRAQCLIEQYSAYIMPAVRIQVNGELTQGENIADNGGLKESFMAYKLWRENHPQADETLPNLDLTGEQLFFLNFAQIWCGMQRTESAKNRMKHAVHSPGLFRVIGTLSNSEDFARVFKCPEGSPMNPSKKCVIW